LVESCLVIFLIGLLFAALFQFSQIVAAHATLRYAAAAGARAKTVGFNRWMVDKVVRVAAIPNAGKLVSPAFENKNAYLRDVIRREKPVPAWSKLLRETPSSAQYAVEKTRIPDYLDSSGPTMAGTVLDYADWKTIQPPEIEATGVASPEGPGAEVTVTVEQALPLRVPVHRAFYAADELKLQSDATMENHYPLYIEDEYR